MKACRGNRSTAPLALTSAIDKDERSNLFPGFHSRKKTVLNEHEAVCAVFDDRKCLFLTGI